MKKFNLTLLSLSLLAESFQVGAGDFSTLTDIPAVTLSHQELEQVSGQYFDTNWMMGMFFLIGKMQGQTNREAAKGALTVGVTATMLNNTATTQSSPIILPAVQKPRFNVTSVVQVPPSPITYQNQAPAQFSSSLGVGVGTSVMNAANNNQNSNNQDLLPLLQPSLNNPNTLAGYLHQKSIADQKTYTPGGPGTEKGIIDWANNKAREPGNLTLLQNFQYQLNRSNSYASFGE